MRGLEKSTISRRPNLSATVFGLVQVLVALAATPAFGQQIYILYGAVDGERMEPFARSGVAVDLMAKPLPTVPLEDDISIRIFRQTASPSLVAVFDSLQVGTHLWSNIDRVNAGADEVRRITFLLLDDASGVESETADQYATVERGGKLHVWPSTSLFGYYKTHEVVIMQESEGRTCHGDDCMQDRPKIRITDTQTESEHLRNLRSSLEQELKVIENHERLVAEAERRIPSILVEQELTEVSLGKQREFAEELQPLLDQEEEQLEFWERFDEQNARNQELRESQRQSLLLVGIPPPPQIRLPRFLNHVREHRKRVTRLSRETGAAEAEVAVAKRDLIVLQAQQKRLRNMLFGLKADLAQRRKWADDLQRAIKDIEDGYLDLTSRRTELVTPSADPTWYFDAEILVGSTVAAELERRLGRRAWISILIHRALNTQILTEDQARARFYKQRTRANKIGWSEIAFFGSGFDSSEILTAKEIAFENGAGIFLSAMYATDLFEPIQAFFVGKGAKYIWPLATEGQEDLVAALPSGGTRTVAVYEHLTPLARETGRIGDVAVGKLAWWSVPASDLVHASSTTTGLLTMLYFGWHDSNAVMQYLLDMTASLWGTVEYLNVVTLAQVMSHYLQIQGWPEATNDPAAIAAVGLIPLAYLDALTNFGLDRGALYPEHPFVDFKTPKVLPRYWSHIRPAMVDAFDRTETSVQNVKLAELARRINDYLVCAVDASSRKDATVAFVSTTCWPSEDAGP